MRIYAHIGLALLFVLWLWFAATQLVLPALAGTKLFPAFRRKEREILNEAVEARQQLKEKWLSEELGTLKSTTEGEKQ